MVVYTRRAPLTQGGCSLHTLTTPPDTVTRRESCDYFFTWMLEFCTSFWNAS